MRQRKAQPWLPGPHSLGRQGRRMRGEGAKGKSIVGGICLKKALLDLGSTWGWRSRRSGWGRGGRGFSADELSVEGFARYRESGPFPDEGLFSVFD